MDKHPNNAGGIREQVALAHAEQARIANAKSTLVDEARRNAVLLRGYDKLTTMVPPMAVSRRDKLAAVVAASPPGGLRDQVHHRTAVDRLAEQFVDQMVGTPAAKAAKAAARSRPLVETIAGKLGTPQPTSPIAKLAEHIGAVSPSVQAAKMLNDQLAERIAPSPVRRVEPVIEPTAPVIPRPESDYIGPAPEVREQRLRWEQELYALVRRIARAAEEARRGQRRAEARAGRAEANEMAERERHEARELRRDKRQRVMLVVATASPPLSIAGNVLLRVVGF